MEFLHFKYIQQFQSPNTQLSISKMYPHHIDATKDLCSGNKKELLDYIELFGVMMAELIFSCHNSLRIAKLHCELALGFWKKELTKHFLHCNF